MESREAASRQLSRIIKNASSTRDRPVNEAVTWEPRGARLFPPSLSLIFFSLCFLLFPFFFFCFRIARECFRVKIHSRGERIIGRVAPERIFFFFFFRKMDKVSSTFNVRKSLRESSFSSPKWIRYSNSREETRMGSR